MAGFRRECAWVRFRVLRGKDTGIPERRGARNPEGRNARRMPTARSRAFRRLRRGGSVSQGFPRALRGFPRKKSSCVHPRRAAIIRGSAAGAVRAWKCRSWKCLRRRSRARSVASHRQEAFPGRERQVGKVRKESRAMHLPEAHRSGDPSPGSRSRSSTTSRQGTTAPRRVRRMVPIVAAILLDAVRGSRTYVTRYSAGRGAE